MLGDNTAIKPQYLLTAKALRPHLNIGSERVSVAIGGESGCGKTVTALALARVLAEEGINAVILHQDDYFNRPPRTNHNHRLLDMGSIGSQEVNLNLLQEHINQFLTGENTLQKPLVDYENNVILTENIDLQHAQIILIEGTYSMLLSNIDTKIFIKRNYHDTYTARIARGRDIANDFVEQVLEIEHQLIAPLFAHADILIERDYGVHKF